jgi:hypothetical protein
MEVRQVAESQKCSFNDRVKGPQTAKDFGPELTESVEEILRDLGPGALMTLRPGMSGRKAGTKGQPDGTAVKSSA